MRTNKWALIVLVLAAWATSALAYPQNLIVREGPQKKHNARDIFGIGAPYNMESHDVGVTTERFYPYMPSRHVVTDTVNFLAVYTYIQCTAGQVNVTLITPYSYPDSFIVTLTAPGVAGDDDFETNVFLEYINVTSTSGTSTIKRLQF